MYKVIKSLEQQRIEEIASKYQQQGYEVIAEPRPDQVLPSLSEFSSQIDLIARKGNELVVIEVKSRASLMENNRIQELAQIIEQHENWRFELALISEPEKVIDDTEGLEGKMQGLNLAAGMKQAKALLEAGFEASALVVAWAVIEAALRELAAREKVTFNVQSSPAQLIKNLAFLGLIAEKDYDSVWNAMKLRNGIVHGFEAEGDFKQTIQQLFLISSKIAKI